MAGEEGWTLYVARDRRRAHRHDLGSVLCLRALQLLPEGAVHVEECRGARAELPWLVGTPTLRDEASGEVWRGHQALSQLELMAVSMAQRAAAATGGTKGHEPAREHERVPPDSVGAWEPDDASMWESRIAETADEDDVLQRKLTGDDLSRALSSRQAAVKPQQQGAAEPPPPPPLKD